MTLQEFYARVGGDYNATLSRLPSEALVKKFILKYPGDPSFAQLEGRAGRPGLGAGFPRQPHTERRGPELRMDRLYKAAAALCDAVRGPKPLEDESLWPPVLCCPRGSAGGNPRTVKPPAGRPCRILCAASLPLHRKPECPAMYNKRRTSRSAAHGLLPAAYQYAIGRAAGLCHALPARRAAMTRPGAPCA